jgi:hypothetical protein
MQPYRNQLKESLLACLKNAQRLTVNTRCGWFCISARKNLSNPCARSMWSTYSELDSGNESVLKNFPMRSNELTSIYCSRHTHLVASRIVYILNNFDVSPSTASAWLAQSVERETLRFHLLNKAIDPSQGCGFDPRIGLFSFCLCSAFFHLFVSQGSTS